MCVIERRAFEGVTLWSVVGIGGIHHGQLVHTRGLEVTLRWKDNTS